MSEHGIKAAPWYAVMFMYLVGQGGLLAAQYFAYKQSGGIAVTLGIAAMQFLASVAAAYGPGSAGRLARSVGNAIATGRVVSSEDQGKDSPPPTGS